MMCRDTTESIGEPNKARSPPQKQESGNPTPLPLRRRTEEKDPDDTSSAAPVASHRIAPATPARCFPRPQLSRIAAGREVRSPDPPPLSSLPPPPPPPPAGPVASHCYIRGRACHTHHARSVGAVVVVEHWDWETSAGRVVPCHRQPISPAIGFVALASVVARRGGAAAAAAATVRGMSFGGASSVAAGGKRPFEYGRTHVVRPKGAHKATIVWLHGLGDNGASWSQLLETLPLPNIKWICPTAPTRPVAIFGGFPSTAWFDVADLSEDSPDDVEGLDSSAAHVANLLSTEPADIKLGVGGFSMGAATALYSGTCFAHGKYGNGNPYPVNLSVAVGLSGWLPCARSLKNKIESSQEAAQKASSLPLMLCHGKADDVVLYKHGERSADALKSTGFANVEFKSYSRLGHYTVPEEMDEVVKWLTASLELGSSSST
uniref:Phospholipase/carboxylesterase/thioesterase domain-containing protein n=1 Tax=Triticum urartu TaxID=4572 RepID=A0A8R7TSX6_TRIUA